MKYFKNTENGEVFGYDENYENDKPLIDSAIENGFEDISDTWNGKFEEDNSIEIKPTKEELLAQLQALTAKIESL